MTAFAEVSRAVQAMRSGFIDYISKPIELDELELKIARVLRTVELEKTEQLVDFRSRHAGPDSDVKGESAVAHRLQHELDMAASAYPTPVFITGETGTGKGVAARALHHMSSVARNNLVVINCASIAESMFESELFGHERGAFTGAVQARRGAFELADGGTLILDEIGEIPLHLQPKLLTVLDDGVVRRVGAEIEREVQLRIVATTNRNIEAMVRDGRFREDLYFRLAVIRIDIPPLRERSEDIPLLVRHFLAGFGQDPHNGPTGKELEQLNTYGWPGNVRELRNVVERYIIYRKLSTAAGFAPLSKGPAPRGSLPQVELGTALVPTTDEFLTIEEMRRRHIMAALARTGENRSAAARLLGVSRSTLKRTLKLFAEEDSKAQENVDGEL